MQLGYTMLCEQTAPKQLVSDLVRAEEIGFDFSVISDHYFPWLEEQGHSPYAWSVLGAAAQGSSQIGLMTFVTCPTMRYHPAVVAQKAATMALLSDGRFTLGLGAGENLNEHVIGRGWPSVDVRHAMLAEAAEVIGLLFDGGYVNYAGQHITADSAKLYDLPPERVPVAIAASGKRSAELAARHGDGLIAVEPDAGVVSAFDAAGGPGKPKYGQIPVCYARDAAEARERAARLWGWASPGWKVMAELPGPASFAAFAELVRPEEITSQVPCGPELGPYLDAARGYADAGPRQSHPRHGLGHRRCLGGCGWRVLAAGRCGEHGVGDRPAVAGLHLVRHRPARRAAAWWHAPVLLLAGTAWGLLLIVPGWLLFPRAVEQRSVASVAADRGVPPPSPRRVRELTGALNDVATAVRSRAKSAEPTVEACRDGLSQVAEAVRRVQASLA